MGTILAKGDIYVYTRFEMLSVGRGGFANQGDGDCCCAEGLSKGIETALYDTAY